MSPEWALAMILPAWGFTIGWTLGTLTVARQEMAYWHQVDTRPELYDWAQELAQ